MNEYEKIIAKELAKKYCKSEKFIVLLIKICKDNKIEKISKYIEKNLT